MNVRCVLLAAACAGALLAQGTDVIRIESREVVVEVGLAGHAALPDALTAKDFNVWEDGKPQKIVSFSRADSGSLDAQKHFVLYFDFTTLQMGEQQASRSYAAAFISGVASPDRYMAVLNMNAAGAGVITDFTTSRSTLDKAIATVQNALPIALNTTPVAATQTTDLTRRTPLILGAPNAGVSDPTGAIRISHALEGLAQSLAPAPGRKALFLFTGGYPLNSDEVEDVRRAIAACNRANIAVYTIVGSRRSGYGGMGDAFASFLSNGTGGEVVVLNDNVPEQLAAIARLQDDVYRLGYVPPDAPANSCHTLRVKVDVKGFETRARQEYCTEKPVDVVAGRIAGSALVARAASGATSGSGGLAPAMQLPYVYTGTNRAVVHVTLEMIPSGMKFQKEKNNDQLHGEIDLVGAATRPDGVTAARFADSVGIDMPDRQRADAFLRAPWRYEHYFTMAAGKYTFDMSVGVGAGNAGARSVGKVSMPLEIAAWTAGRFGMGGIALSREIRPVGESTRAAGPVLEGRGPMVAQGVELTPAGSTRFRRSEHLYFYTEIYEPSLDSAAPAAVQIQYRVFDRGTGQLSEQSPLASIEKFVRPGNTAIPVATTIPVSTLKPGQYRLVVSASHSSGPDLVTRAVDFELD